MIKGRKKDMASHLHQTIHLTGNDENSSFVVGNDAITIHASSNSTENRVVEASNKVKINPIVRFDWDKRAYFGRVIAVHKNGQFVAYSLKPATAPGGGAVRVIHLATAIKHLMKGFNGRVVDLDFSCRDLPTLACIDENGLVVVYTIHLTDNNLEAKRILQIVPSYPNTTNSELRRLRWCPYVPGPDSGGSSWLEAMLAVSHRCKLELFDVDFLARQYDNAMSIKSEHLKQGYLSIEEHTKAITEIAPSPDGFAIATASLDGSVNFYELPEQLQSNYVMNRMYHWIPHEGNPVNTLIFLDDRRPGHKTNLWCNALTGTHDSRELSIWSCDRWEVIQRISINGPLSTAHSQESGDPPGKIFVRSDLSGRLIVMSDVTRSVLYVLELEGAGGSDAPVHCHGVHEFVLASTCLDLAVINVKRSENDSLDGENNAVSVEIEASGIYPKSLQSLQIHFHSVLGPPGSQTLSNDTSSDDEDAVENLAASSSLTGVSPVSSMLTELNIAVNGPLPTVDAALPPQEQQLLARRGSEEDDEEDEDEEPEVTEVGDDADAIRDVLSRASTATATSAVVMVEEPPAREEWPAAPELHICDVLSSRTSSSAGGGINVAVVAPRETASSLGPCDEGPSETVENVQEQLRQLDLRSPLGNGPEQERPVDDGEEEDEEIPEIIDALGSREADDSDDGDESDNDEDELGNEEDAATTDDGDADDDDDDEADMSGDDGEEANTIRGIQRGSPRPVIADSGPPAWAAALLSQISRQAEQVAAVQEQLVQERQQRVEMMEMLRRMELSYSRLTDHTTQSRNDWKSEAATHRSALLSANEGVVSQCLGIRKSVEQKMADNHRAFMVQQEQLFQKMVNEVSAKVYHSVLANLNTMLSNEISSVVLPNVRGCIEDVRTNLSSTLHDKLMAMDAVIREQINKVFKQKNVIDMIGRSTSDALRRAVVSAVEEQTRTILMPEMNSALHHNANRLRELLRKSMEDVQSSVAHTEQERREHIEGLLTENKQAIDKQLTTSLRHLENSLESYMTRLSKNVNETMTNVSTEIRDTVATAHNTTGPIGDSRQNSSSPFPRQPGSPMNVEIPITTLRKQMMQRLAAEQYTKALHEVLMHTRPELLTEFCRLVTPNQIFTSHLPQNVVLSFLSQLTNTLQQDTETKIKFIMEAFVHLDKNDPAYNTYGPKTLSLLKKKVEMYMRDNPNTPYQSELRFLMMALNSR